MTPLHWIKEQFAHHSFQHCFSHIRPHNVSDSLCRHTLKALTLNWALIIWVSIDHSIPAWQILTSNQTHTLEVGPSACSVGKPVCLQKVTSQMAPAPMKSSTACKQKATPVLFGFTPLHILAWTRGNYIKCLCAAGLFGISATGLYITPLFCVPNGDLMQPLLGAAFLPEFT